MAGNFRTLTKTKGEAATAAFIVGRLHTLGRQLELALPNLPTQAQNDVQKIVNSFNSLKSLGILDAAVDKKRPYGNIDQLNANLRNFNWAIATYLTPATAFNKAA